MNENERDDAAGTEEGTDAGPARTRRRPGMRDMLLSMLGLGILVLILTMLAQGSVNPAGSNAPVVQTVDVPGELQAAAARVHFPLRQPGLPGTWRANSASVDPLGADGARHAVRIGWIAPGGLFVQLSQSDGTALDLARRAAGYGDDTPVPVTGHTTVDGTDWTVYPGIRSEASWVADLGPVRLLITGSGTDAEFRTMAGAVRNGRIVTAGG